MLAFFRLLQILRIVARYRLDQLLPAKPWYLRPIFWLMALRPQSQLGRGERLRRSCEDLGPVFIKFGQLLSTRPDVVAPDIVMELDHLQDNVTPFSSDTVVTLIETSLGQPIDQLFATFESAPLASASIAQVHAATLHTGEDVVVKVIRPNLAATINQDIALLSLLAKIVERFLADGKRLRPQEVVEDYRHVIFDELNLQREAANASQLRRNFLNSSMLYVPEVYWDFCRRDVMVMERIYGIPVTNIDELKAQNTNMKLLAERGVEIFFTQVFEHNFFHADMHPGNIFVSRKEPQAPQYIAVDMAIVGSLDREDQYYLARNLLAMFRRDYRQVAELHVQSGWVPPETRISDFEAAIRSVCEPIFEKPLKEISFAQVLISLFQTARRFNMEIQPQLVLLQKTLLNIEGLGRQLYPDLDLWTTAHPYLERWLKNRFHPRSLWAQLKRYGPEWMEQFPNMPQKMAQALDQVQAMGDLAPVLTRAAAGFGNQAERRQRYKRRSLIAIAAIGGAVALAFPKLQPYLTGIPWQSWFLLAIGATAWVLR